MCQVIIDGIQGDNYDPVSGEFTAIYVLGRVQGCPSTIATPDGGFAQVAVHVATDSGQSHSTSTSVLTNGNLTQIFHWSAFFKDIRCKGKAHIQATCTGTPDCTVEADIELACTTPSCPPVSFSVPVDAGCNGAGERLTALTATVSGPPLNQFVLWRYGANRVAQSAFSNSTQTTVELAWGAQDLPNPVVIFALTPDCEYPLEISPGLRTPCDTPCPQVTFGAPQDSGCDASENRVVSVSAQISGAPVTGYVLWHYGAERTSPVYLQDANQVTVDLLFAPADLAEQGVVLEITPECTYSLTLPRRLLQPCETRCPEVTLGAPRDRGCDEGGNRIISVSAQISGTPVTGYVVWHYGDGRTAQTYLEGAHEVEAELLYGAADLGTSEFALELTPDCVYPGTVPESLRQSCTPPPGPGNGGGTGGGGGNGRGGFNLCQMWLIANLLLLLLTGIAIIAAGCAPNPYTIGIAVAMAIVTALSWFLFWLICLRATGDCDLARWASFLLDLLATAMAVIALVWGIITAIFELTLGCFIGAFIVFAYYALIALWFKNVVIMMGCYRDASYFPWEN